MDTEEEIARDSFISDLYSDFAHDVLAGRDGDLYGQVVEQFASERLQSFYLENPEVAKPAVWALEEARALHATHPAAALVFAVTAIEVGLKATLLKPILHGLVHADFAGPLIADLATDHRQDKFKGLVFAVLSEYGGIDLRTYKRDPHRKSLWEEIGELQTKRNAVAHRAQSQTSADASVALEVAGHVIEHVFPLVIETLGLHTHKPGLAVCNKEH